MKFYIPCLIQPEKSVSLCSFNKIEVVYYYNSANKGKHNSESINILLEHSRLVANFRKKLEDKGFTPYIILPYSLSNCKV